MKLRRYAASAAIVVSPFTLPAGAETLDTLAEFGNAATANATSDAGTARGFTNPATDEYTITAGGTDIWGNSDNGSFIYDADKTRAAGENFSVIVRSVSIAGDPAEQLATQWGRTGPMARKTPDSANSANVANIRKSVGDTIIQGRQADGGGTDRGPGNNGEFGNTAANGDVRTNPIWLALHRHDGEWYGTWAPDAGGVPGAWSTAIQRLGTPDMAGEVYVGLAHQSHNINPVVNTAVFDNFSVQAFDPDLGDFPVIPSCDLNLGPGGILLTASGTEVGTVTPIDVDWEARFLGNEEIVPGVLSADIYLAGNPGNLAAIETLIAGTDPDGSTQIEQISWTEANYTGTNAAGVNLFAQAVPGQFGGNQENYGVVMTGEIHIPNDTDRNLVESVKFHDGVDDFCYLEIDGVELINDNTWTNFAGTAGNAPGGGAQGTLDVSDSKYDDGEWVSFRMITWEGGGGDHGNLVWDALDVTGSDSVTGGADTATGTYPAGFADGVQVNYANDASDQIPAANFRALVPGLKGTVSGTGQPVDEDLGALPAGSLFMEIYINGELCTTAPTIVSLQSAQFTSVDTLEVVLADVGTGGIADLDESTILATLDGNPVGVTTNKVDQLTTVTYVFPSPPTPYTNYTLAITGTTTAATGSVAVDLAGTARSLPFLTELRAGLSAPPNATVGWDYMEFDAVAALGRNLGAGSDSFIDAQTVISTAAAPIAQANQPYINHSDPDNDGGRGDWTPDLPILSDTAAVDENQFVTYARTTITIGAGEEGEYTFRVTGDDGFGLRVAGAEFTVVNGQAQNSLDPVDRSVVFRPDYGGGGNAVAVCNFPAAGDYLVEFFGFEGGGGAYQEISWAPGVFSDVDETTTWTLLGDTSGFVPDGSAWGDIPEAILPPLPEGEDGWSTYIYYAAPGDVGSLANTMNYLRNVADPATATATILPALNHADDGANAGRFNPSDAYPGDPLAGGDTNDIAMIARALIVAPVSGDYTIQVRSDDGFLLRFTDPTNVFSTLNGGGSLRAANPNEVYFAAGTGDSNTRASVYLEAGTHELVYIWWEGGGGSHFEISAAPGIEPSQDGPYELLDTTEKANNLYVAGGVPIPIIISEIVYDEPGNRVTLTFNTKAGTTYVLKADTDLVGFETEVDDNVVGTGGEVTYGPFISPFPAGTPKVFFRLEEAP